MSDFIPVNEPLLGESEKRNLIACIDTGWISSEGPFVTQFEQGMAAQTGRAHGVAVANGSVALDTALAALQLPAGGEVILPTFTIISCAAAIVRAGLVPVAVDCDPRTWNMTPAHVEAALTPRTCAIMVVHLYGLPVEMGPILELAAARGIPVVEDAAELIGQTWHGKPCGSFGAISTFSFYPNKHVTTGEGGMVLADDPALAERSRSLRNLCFGKRRFIHEELGWNFRMSNLQAALGAAQLERLPRAIETKRRMGRRYDELLAPLAEHLELPQASMPGAENIYWVYGMVLRDHVPFDADEAMARLAKLGIGTRPFFWPMHEQPVFHKMGLLKGLKLPVAERIARRGFYVPSGLALTDAQMVRVAEALTELLRSL